MSSDESAACTIKKKQFPVDAQCFLFQNYTNSFFGYLDPDFILKMMKITNVRGDLTDISAKIKTTGDVNDTSAKFNVLVPTANLDRAGDLFALVAGTGQLSEAGLCGSGSVDDAYVKP